MTGGAQDSGVERGKVTPEMMQAWTNFEPVIPNTPPSQLRDSVLLRQGFMAGWMAANRATPAPVGWQPIDSAPRDGTIILIAAHKQTYAAYWSQCERAFGGDKQYPWVTLDETNGVNGWMDGPHGPTHWTPLPALPTAPAEGGV